MQCASCHTTGIGFVEGKIGLLDYVQNLDTGMAISAPNVIKSLRKATQGRTTDMRPMNLLDEELTAITRYLMTFQKGL
jgi:mono/diheme cytochrome c family protein